MKKAVKIIINVLIAVHLIFWVMILFLAVSELLTNEAPPDTGGLEGWFADGIDPLLVVLAVLGVITSAILFFAARAVLYRPGEKHKKRKIAALIFSCAAAVFFYALLIWNYFHFFIYMLNAPLVIALSALWFLCEVCCIVSLAIFKEKKTAIAVT